MGSSHQTSRGKVSSMNREPLKESPPEARTNWRGVGLCLLALAIPTFAVAQDGAPTAPPPDPVPAATIGPMTPTIGKGARVVSPEAVTLPPAKIGSGVWVARGPGVTQMGQVEGITNFEVSGAIHTVAAHPTDPDILWIGGTNGGIWKTTNATNASPNWTPLTDFESSLSIGALELDPTDGTNQTLVAGIGRYSSFAQIGGNRTGLLKSIDGGANWTPITGAGALATLDFSGVAPRGSTIVTAVGFADAFTCSNVGIWRSTDSGGTFSNLGFVGGSGLPLGVAFDLAGDRMSASTLYTGITYGDLCSGPGFSNGIFKSTDTGATWTKVSSPAMDSLIVDGITNNIEIAADGLSVFANIVQNGQTAGIFYSANGGTTWAVMDRPLTPEGNPVSISPGTLTPGTPIIINNSAPHGLSTGMQVAVTGVGGTVGADGVWPITVTSSLAFSLNGSSDATPWTPGTGSWIKLAGLNPKIKPGAQGGIHASILSDPTTPTTVYLGGDRQDLPFPNFIGALDFSGRLFRGDATATATGVIPSPQWEHLTHSDSIASIPDGGTANTSAPHADSREMVFDANGDIIEVDDGGVYRRTNPTSNAGDWFSINGDIQVTEIHDVAWDTVSDIIISGNQDTGTTQQPTPGATTWISVHTGDGGDVAVDATTVSGQSTRYSSYQNLGAFRRRSYDASNAFLGEVFPTRTVTAPDQTFFSNFLTPVELNAIDPTRLVIGGCNAVFESSDQGENLTQIPGLFDSFCQSFGIFSLLQNAIAYGGTSGAVDNEEVLYVGAGMSIYVRTAAHPAALTLSASYPGAGIISDVVLDSDEWRTAFVVDPTKVYWTDDAGATWIEITGNLTDTGLQSAAFIPGSTDTLVVGGRTGVFELALPPNSPYTWAELGAGSLPNAPVWDMDYDVVDGVLVAGTLGRGAWTMQIADDPPLFADDFESGDTSAWSKTVPP